MRPARRLAIALSDDCVRRRASWNYLMFSAEQLFMWNLEQLLIYHNNPTPENLFASVGPLRRLLMDETPLLHLVNRKLRVKVIFVMEPPEGLPPMERFARKEMNLDKFLTEPIAYVRGQWLTVA